MTTKKVVYQGHHPSRALFPNYTIRLRKWVHLYVRRLEQFKPTKQNLEELNEIVKATTWIYNLKCMEYAMNEDLTCRVLEGTYDGEDEDKEAGTCINSDSNVT